MVASNTTGLDSGVKLGCWCGLEQINCRLVDDMACPAAEEVILRGSDNQQDISVESLAKIELAVQILSAILLALGGPGNLLCMAVFCRMSPGKDRINVCLLSLAVVDLLTVITWFLLGLSFDPLLQIHLDTASILILRWRMRQYVRGIHHGFMFSSGCIMTFISVERAISVTFPLHAANIITTRTTRIILAVIMVVVQLLCISYPLTYNVNVHEGTDQEDTTITIDYTEVYIQNRVLMNVIQSIVLQFCIPLITVIITSVSTALTVRYIHRSNVWRATAVTSSSNTHQRHVGSKKTLMRMLVILCMIYVITAIPGIVLSIWRLTDQEFFIAGTKRNMFVGYHHIYWTLGSVNSTVNFFLYYVRSQKFRNAVRNLVPKACRKRGPRVTTLPLTSVTERRRKMSERRKPETEEQKEDYEEEEDEEKWDYEVIYEERSSAGWSGFTTLSSAKNASDKHEMGSPEAELGQTTQTTELTTLNSDPELNPQGAGEQNYGNWRKTSRSVGAGVLVMQMSRTVRNVASLVGITSPNAFTVVREWMSRTIGSRREDTIQPKAPQMAGARGGEVELAANPSQTAASRGGGGMPDTEAENVLWWGRWAEPYPNTKHDEVGGRGAGFLPITSRTVGSGSRGTETSPRLSRTVGSGLGAELSPMMSRSVGSAGGAEHSPMMSRSVGSREAEVDRSPHM